MLSGLLLAAMTPALAAPDEILPEAEQIIKRADALGADSNFDGAIKLLTSGTKRYPTYERLYLSLARWQEVKGLFALKIDDNNLDDRKAYLLQHLDDYPDT
ncbi:MAG: hypothetical protein JRN22_03975, partial [Nitrososphaerota archaeon]|nr:hypothetical protein [Nitrososphaerota archaeon]